MHVMLQAAKRNENKIDIYKVMIRARGNFKMFSFSTFLKCLQLSYLSNSTETSKVNLLVDDPLWNLLPSSALYQGPSGCLHPIPLHLPYMYPGSQAGGGGGG